MAEVTGGKGFSLKDALFNQAKVDWLAGQFAGAVPGFDASAFTAAVMGRLPALELKARIGLIADVLQDHLPGDFPAAADAITRALPPPLDPTRSDDDFGDFIFAPLGEYVARHGQAEGHLDLALASLREITMRFSMEDAIRAFLRAWPERTLAVLEGWADDPNYHVRRLVSEGTRPRLPWSGRLPLPVETALPLLDRLHADPTRYVTRSVANHLNDIAKDSPAPVLAALARWQNERRQAPAELDWMTRHALRTLVKAGNPEALALLGYGAAPEVAVTLAIDTPRVAMGDSLSFTVTLRAGSATRVLVDYVIDFARPNGRRAEKVFKLRALALDAGETRQLDKRHRLLADATTYRLTPGRHHLTLQVNGQPGPSAAFEVVERGC